MIAKQGLLTIAITFLAGGWTLCIGSVTDLYVAQSAAGTAEGTSCANAKTASFFNASTNWGSGASQIGPDSTVHICGTFTGTAGDTALTFQGSGTAGHVITLLAEAGAHFTAPYWGSNGAINLNGQSHVLVNGGPTCGWSAASQTVTACNLVIEDTQNGTNLQYRSASRCFEIGVSGSTDLEFMNFDCHNLYQRAGSDQEDGNYVFQNCFDIAWSGAGTTNLRIHNAIMHDGGWCLNAGGPGPFFYGPGLEMYNFDHGISTGAVTQYIYGNHLHDWAIWTNSSGTYHHDGDHCFSGAAGSTDVIYMYNNQFDGDPGNLGTTSWAFLEGNGSATSCFLSGATGLYFFNNVGVLANNISGEIFAVGNSGGNMKNAFVANNTLVGNQQSNTVPQGGLVFQRSSGNYMRNNAIGGVGWLVNVQAGLTVDADYNFYENSGPGTGMFSPPGSNFSQWQASGHDAHGGANLSSTTYFDLNSACTATSVGAKCNPVAGSPLIGAGQNLYSTCSGQPNPGLGALCFDFTGAPRPSTGGWDVGAYQVNPGSGNSTSIGPPSNLSAMAR